MLIHSMRRAAVLRDHLLVATHRIVRTARILVAVLPNDVLVAVRAAVEHRTIPMPVRRVNAHPRILARNLLFFPDYFVLGDEFRIAG